jgi:hypothetical protein
MIEFKRFPRRRLNHQASQEREGREEPEITARGEAAAPGKGRLSEDKTGVRSDKK